VHNIDYEETFSPVANMDSIQLALSILVTKGWEVHQMYMKNEFLHKDLSEEIYKEQPQGFMNDSYLVYRLKKSLYYLKRAPRAWYSNMESYLLSHNFVRCKSYPNVYMLRTIDSLLLLVLYVDDLLITCYSTLLIAVGQLRGGVNQLLPCLNNYASFKIFTRHSMMITIMQGNEQWHIQHQSHI
jgi:hypothetical protein